METFINLVFLLVGFALGTLVKVAYDYYHAYLLDQQKIKSEMEEVLYRFKKMEAETLINNK